MLNIDEINVIGNILNTTWGKFSTDRGSFPVGSAPPGSLTCKLAQTQGPALELPKDVINKKRAERSGSTSDTGTVLIVTYTDVVSFRSDQEVQANTKIFRDIAEKRCAAKIAETREQFRGTAGRSLKIKLKESHDSIESTYTTTPDISLIGAPAIRPQLFRGYYRYVAVYDIA